MKKLFRQEWKYYLLFLIGIVCCLSVRSGVFRDMWPLGLDEDLPRVAGVIVFLGGNMEYDVGHFYLYGLTDVVLMPMMISILLVKICFFWIEKDSYARDFLQTLPVKRVDRIRFHLLMDSLLIAVCLTIYGALVYCDAQQRFAASGLELPWFGKSVAGLIITDICYLLFLLGIINFLECLFVNGAIRILGVVSCMGMSAYSAVRLFITNESSSLVQKVFGFLFLQSVGNRAYSLELARSRAASVAVNHIFVGNSFIGWTHDMFSPEIIYQGKALEYTIENLHTIEPGLDISRFSTLYDFSRISSYGWYALAYIGIAALLAGTSIWMFGKQELSKEGVYFTFAKYLLSALISGTLFLFINVNPGELWHVCFSAAATVLIFITLVILMTPDSRERIFAKLQR